MSSLHGNSSESIVHYNKEVSQVNKLYFALPLIGGLMFPLVRFAARSGTETNRAFAMGKNSKTMKIIALGAFGAFLVKFSVGMLYEFPEFPPSITFCQSLSV